MNKRKQRSMERVEYNPFIVGQKVIRPSFAETCDECDGTGEVHSHNPKCWDCCGFGWVLPEHLRLHRDVLNGLEQVDAAVFSGDSLENRITFAVMAHYIDRWSRTLEQLRSQLVPMENPKQLDVACFVCGAGPGKPCVEGLTGVHRTRICE